MRPEVKPPLILGAGGQLGTAFMRLLQDPVPVGRQNLDLATASTDNIQDLYERVRPSIILNCAAYTKVDKAESEEALATAINGHAVGRLAAAAARVSTPFVTYSTDYVFDGGGRRPYVESDPTAPLNAYGRSKLVGEDAVQEANPDALIVRTSWVLSVTHPNFVGTILRRAREGQISKVVDDQVGRPTIADDLAVASLQALTAGAKGLLHLTNEGETTWFQLAATAMESAGLAPDLVVPCTTDEYPTPAPRPSYSVLGSEVAPALGVRVPHWKESIDRVVAGAA